MTTPLLKHKIQSNEDQRLKSACYSALHHYTDAEIQRVRSLPYILVRPHSPIQGKYITKFNIVPIRLLNVVSVTTGTVITNVNGFTHIALLRPTSDIDEDNIRELIFNKHLVPSSYTAIRTFLEDNNIKYTLKRAQMTLLKILLDATDEYKGQYWGDEQPHNWYVFTIYDAPPTLVFDKETTRHIDDHITVTAVRITDTVAHNSKFYRKKRRMEAYRAVYYNEALSYIFDGWDVTFDGYKKVREPNDSEEFNRKGRESIQQYFESIYNTFLSDGDIDANVVRYIRAHVTVNEVFNRLNDIPTSEDEITFEQMIKYDKALINRIMYGTSTPPQEIVFDNTSQEK